MNRVFFAFALFLLLAGSASAADLTTSNAPVPDAAQDLFLPAPTKATSCTLQCWPDPYNPSAPPLTCTSATGNCSSGGKGTFFYIMCDGNMIVCPEYY